MRRHLEQKLSTEFQNVSMFHGTFHAPFRYSVHAVLKKAMSTLYRIALGPTPKTSDRAFFHKQNGSLFVPERCSAASVLKVNRHISDRLS